MADLGPVAWPPAPIRTQRLVLREPERSVPEVARWRPGLSVVDLDGAMIGIVTPDRRDAERKGHIAPEGGEVERFEEYGAEQWLGVWSSVTPSG